MMIGMLVAGIGLVLAGLLAIGYGISVKEFSVGNTLIQSGVIGVCTGVLMFGFWTTVRELKNIARRLGAGAAQPRGEVTVRPVLPPGLTREGAQGGDAGFPINQPAAESAGSAEPAAPSSPPPPPPWQDEAASRSDASAEAAAAEAAAKPKRNLLFSSTSRKERERAQARTSEPLPPDLLSADLRPNPPAVPPPAEPAEPPPASFDDAWPKPERPKSVDVSPQRRTPRPSTFEANGAAPRPAEQPAVTVLKSGVVDGMAYSLYSDGSIEAQMPEGMMRFASIDELRSHLDQRP
jgi:hypothetical protein